MKKSCPATCQNMWKSWTESKADISSYMSRPWTRTGSDSYLSGSDRAEFRIKDENGQECVYSQELGFGSSYTLIILPSITFGDNVRAHSGSQDRFWMEVTHLCTCLCPAVLSERPLSDGHQSKLRQLGLADSSVFPHDCRRGGLLCHRPGVLLLTGTCDVKCHLPSLVSEFKKHLWAGALGL